MDPYRHVIKPMLAESRETPFDSPDHVYELKWDGTRAICFVRGGQRFQNRRLTFIQDRYPEIRVRTKKDAILDGEIVVMDGALPSFAKLQEREHASAKIRIDFISGMGKINGKFVVVLEVNKVLSIQEVAVVASINHQQAN